MHPVSPSDPSANAMRRALAEAKSYTTQAVITFFLYGLFWLPGLIFNIMYLNEARENQRIVGRPPAGMGCLWLLLWFNIIPFFVCCGFPFMRLLGES